MKGFNLNKHNSDDTISRDGECHAQGMPYFAMLFGEDGRRWLGLVSIEEFEHAQSRGATPNGGPNQLKLDSLILRQIYAGGDPGARVFDAPRRQRPTVARNPKGNT